MNQPNHLQATVLLSLGSNLGVREAHLNAALVLLEEQPGIQVIRRSRFYETAPVGVLEQPAFLNIAAEIETDLSPLELLNVAQDVERLVGRIPSFRWGPRVIDIDVILWGNEVIRDARLTVPHPAFRSRAFVLRPLAEIAPDARDPETGLLVGELAARVAGEVEVFENTP